MAGRRGKAKVPGKIRHAEHHHPQTKHYSVLCRKNMIETGEPLSVEEAGTPAEAHVTEPPLTRGRRLPLPVPRTGGSGSGRSPSTASST